jgi:Lens epithelium-derived growth factor (LEDGF)
LKIEVRLLQIDTVIKAKLSLDKAETKPVLQVLEELKNLKLSPIMLKKHPDIVFTIKKVFLVCFFWNTDFNFYLGSISSRNTLAMSRTGTIQRKRRYRISALVLRCEINFYTF